MKMRDVEILGLEAFAMEQRPEVAALVKALRRKP